MIRRVISLLIALAGAAVLFGWWQRGNEPPPALPSPETAIVESEAPTAVATAEDGAGEVASEAGDVAKGEPVADVVEEPVEPAMPTQAAVAGWTPTLVEFDHSDRNAVIALLQRADAAMTRGNLFTPAGENAVDLYFTVLDAAPDNSRARAGLDRTLEAITRQVESALTGGDYPRAADALPVLQQLKGDAASTLRARDTLDEAGESLELMRRADRAMERNRLDQGRRSAVAYLGQVLDEEPDNRAALDRLAEIQRRLIEQALVNGEKGEFAEAEALLERAETVDPEADDVLAEARSGLAQQRTQNASSLFDQAHRELDQGEVAKAEALLDQALAISSDAPGIGALRDRIRNARIYGGRSEGERFSDVLDIGGNGPSMVVIPVGSFLMGSPDGESGRRNNEGPQFRVRIDHGLALAESEITVAQFRRFVETTNYRTRAEQARRSTIYDDGSGSMRERRGITWRHGEYGDTADDRNPVVHVAWEDAAAYAAWLAQSTSKPYRLPSEAEFEYALRAGTTTRYPWGDGAPSRPMANVSTQGDQSPAQRTWSNAFAGPSDGWFGIAPVRSFPANPFGLYDLEGNVGEWVEDCWHSSYLRAPADGRAWVNPGCSQRVVRGASWASGPEQVRSAYRLNVAADTSNPRVGFRVALSLE